MTTTAEGIRPTGPVDDRSTGPTPFPALSPADGPTSAPVESSTRDRVLALLPAACAVHCLLTPVLAAGLPFIALGPTGEWIAFAVSTVIAGWAVRTTASVHGRKRVWLPTAAGAAVWLASLLGFLHVAGQWEWSAGIGGLLVASGVIWSSRLRHRRVCAKGGCLV